MPVFFKTIKILPRTPPGLRRVISERYAKVNVPVTALEDFHLDGLRPTDTPPHQTKEVLIRRYAPHLSETRIVRIGKPHFLGSAVIDGMHKAVEAAAFRVTVEVVSYEPESVL